MSIEALYPSRRQPQAANPLLRRAQRRHRAIVVFAIVASCTVVMAGWRIFPNEASAAGRPATSAHRVTVTAMPVHHIRVIPLYHIPPEQAGVLSYGN